MKRTKTITFRLTDEEWRLLQALCALGGVCSSSVLRCLIRNGAAVLLTGE